MANGVYWVGQDGKTYIRTEGMANAEQWRAPLLSPTQMGLQLIDDPVNPTRAPSRAPTGGGGGGGGSVAPPRPVLNQAAVDNTSRTINEIPGILQAALATEGTRYQNSVNEFNSQEGVQRGTYDKGTVTNQQNYDDNFMDSIRAGVKGLGGLFNILRGTGAAGGSIEGDVRGMVGGITSKDIRTGADTQEENQGQLDSSLSNFLTELGRKRRMADDTRVNNERAVRRDAETQLQDLYGKMAGYYGEAGDSGAANHWMSRAGSLTPSIAANSKTALSAYDTTPVAVQAPQIAAFTAPTQPDAVVAPQDGQVGSGIFTMERRRKDPSAVGV